MNLLNNIRFVILLALVATSAYVFLSPRIFSGGGVFVSSIDQRASCAGLSVGSRIAQVGGRNILTVDDYDNAVSNIKKGEFVPLLVDSRPGNCVALADGDLGIQVSSQHSQYAAASGTELSTELGGGTIYTYRLSENRTAANASIASSVAQLIEKRALIFGFADVKAESFDGDIKITASSERGVGTLLYPGVLEARMVENIKLQNNSGTFFVGDVAYNFSLEKNSSSILFEGKHYAVGSSFVVNDVKFYYTNSTGSNVILEAPLFDNNEVLRVATGGSVLEYDQRIRQYRFQMTAVVTQNASERFQNVNRHAPTTVSEGKVVIDGFLVYYFDGREISRLVVPLEFTRAPLQSIGIVGFAPTGEQAKEQRLKVLAALEGGKLDRQLVFVNKEQVEPTMKKMAVAILFSSAIITFLMTSVASIRYKNIRGGITSFILIFAGLFVALGMMKIGFAFSGTVLVLGMGTIYAVSISAVIMAILFIISGEKIIRAKEMDLRFGYRRVMSVRTLVYIAGTAFAVVVAMLYDRSFAMFLLFAMLVDWIIINGIREHVLKYT